MNTKLYHDPLAASERAILDACGDFRLAVDSTEDSDELVKLRARLRVLEATVMKLVDHAACRADYLSEADIAIRRIETDLRKEFA